MEANVKEYIIEKVTELISAPTCCAEAKDAGQNWLKAVGTDREADAAKILIAELEEDIMPIEKLISFAGSEAGAQVFGEEKAKQVQTHAKDVKASGAKFCDCPACAACEAILEKKEALLYK